MHTRFEIIEARAHHCGQMIRLLRREHAAAIAQIGAHAHRELRACFDASSFRRAWLIDGQLAAIGGVTGSLLAPSGFLWLALAERARRYPVAVVKEARRQIADIMTTKRELATTILGGDSAGRRLAVFMRFHVADEGPGAPAACRPDRHVLARHLDSDPSVRLPIGSGFAIAMGYHEPEREAA